MFRKESELRGADRERELLGWNNRVGLLSAQETRRCSCSGDTGTHRRHGADVGVSGLRWYIPLSAIIDMSLQEVYVVVGLDVSLWKGVQLRWDCRVDTSETRDQTNKSHIYKRLIYLFLLIHKTFFQFFLSDLKAELVCYDTHALF